MQNEITPLTEICFGNVRQDALKHRRRREKPDLVAAGLGELWEILHRGVHGGFLPWGTLLHDNTDLRLGGRAWLWFEPGYNGENSEAKTRITQNRPLDHVFLPRKAVGDGQRVFARFGSLE